MKKNFEFTRVNQGDGQILTGSDPSGLESSRLSPRT